MGLTNPAAKISRVLLSGGLPDFTVDYPFMPGQTVLAKSASAANVYQLSLPGDQSAKRFSFRLAANLGNAELDVAIPSTITAANVDASSADTAVDPVQLTTPGASTGINSLRAVIIRDSTGLPLRRRGNDILDQAAVVSVTSAATNVLTLTSHGLTEGATVIPAATYGAGPGLVAGTPYFVHVINANTFNVASSLANLVAGTYITVGTVGAPANFTFGYMSTSSFKVKSTSVLRLRGPDTGSWKAGETFTAILVPQADIQGIGGLALGTQLNAHRTYEDVAYPIVQAVLAANEEVNFTAGLPG